MVWLVGGNLAGELFRLLAEQTNLQTAKLRTKPVAHAQGEFHGRFVERAERQLLRITRRQVTRFINGQCPFRIQNGGEEDHDPHDLSPSANRSEKIFPNTTALPSAEPVI